MCLVDDQHLKLDLAQNGSVQSGAFVRRQQNVEFWLFLDHAAAPIAVVHFERIDDTTRRWSAIIDEHIEVGPLGERNLPLPHDRERHDDEEGSSVVMLHEVPEKGHDLDGEGSEIINYVLKKKLQDILNWDPKTRNTHTNTLARTSNVLPRPISSPKMTLRAPW